MLSKFIEERLLFSREYASGCYSASAYFCAVNAVELVGRLSIVSLSRCAQPLSVCLLVRAAHSGSCGERKPLYIAS
jgi:hypothetical protein